MKSAWSTLYRVQLNRSVLYGLSFERFEIILNII